MSLQNELRYAVFGEGMCRMPGRGRSRDEQIRQARENLTRVLNDWINGKNSCRRKLSPGTFTLPEKAGGWPRVLMDEYLSFHRRAWLEFEKIRLEVLSGTPRYEDRGRASAEEESAMIAMSG